VIITSKVVIIMEFKFLYLYGAVLRRDLKVKRNC
jgi:hypothetical protein